jgi:hypothetical protein
MRPKAVDTDRNVVNAQLMPRIRKCVRGVQRTYSYVVNVAAASLNLREIVTSYVKLRGYGINCCWAVSGDSFRGSWNYGN